MNRKNIIMAVYVCTQPVESNNKVPVTVMIKFYPDEEVARERCQITMMELGEHFHLVSTVLKQISFRTAGNFTLQEDLNRELKDYYVILNINNFKQRKLALDIAEENNVLEGPTDEMNRLLHEFCRVSEPICDLTEALVHMEDYAPVNLQPEFCSYENEASLPDVFTFLVPCQNGYQFTFDESDPKDAENYKETWSNYQGQMYRNVIDDPLYLAQRAEYGDDDFLSCAIYPFLDNYLILERAGGANTRFARITKEGENCSGIYYDIIMDEQITELVSEITDEEADRIRKANRQMQQNREEYFKSL